MWQKCSDVVQRNAIDEVEMTMAQRTMVNENENDNDDEDDDDNNGEV